MKFFREYVERRGTLERSVHLHAGGAWAKAFEVYRKAFYGDNVEHEEAIHQGLRALFRYWGDYEAPEGSPKHFINVAQSWIEYFDDYPPSLDPVKPYIDKEGKPAIEFRFAIPLPILHPESGDPIIYGGRFDMLARYAGALYVLDEKTASRFEKSWSRKWHMRSQFLGYVWAAREYGYKVAGAIVRGTAIYKYDAKNLPCTIDFPLWRTDHWHKQMLRDVQRMVDLWNEGHWDMNYGETCTQYFNLCQFMDLCESDTPEAWYDRFVERHWNPIAPDPTAPEEEQI